TAPAVAGHDDKTVRRVLWSFALTGCAALSYEVIWTRALTFFVGNSTYAFSAMLTTFLCGLALGSLLVARVSDRSGDSLSLLGAIAGAWLSGFVAIPLLGTHHSLALTALLSVAIGGVLLTSSSTSRLRQGVLYAGALSCFIAVLVATPTFRFADIAGEPEKAILHYEEDVAGVVKVATDIYDRKLLSINGWSVAGTGSPNPDVALVNDYPEVQKMLAHLPMLLHPAPQRVLVIGFGAGGTAWSLSRYAALRRLDIVEFVPGVIRAARFFPEVN